MQASVSNFAFQTPNQNYYHILGKLKYLKTGQTSEGMNTPVASNNQIGFMSTMVGTNVTGQQI
jgi:hypothetical protein